MVSGGKTDGVNETDDCAITDNNRRGRLIHKYTSLGAHYQRHQWCNVDRLVHISLLFSVSLCVVLNLVLAKLFVMSWLSCIFIGFFALAVAFHHDQFTLDKKPNIVFILTDDQDLHMDSVDYMTLLQKYLVKEGTSYKRHYCSTAICCPSRVTL
jgi:hypothetical protein